MTSRKKAAYPWAFRARFRREAFGWRSEPAIARVREAVAEIKKVAKTDALVAAEGAVLFFERVSPALAHVDSSSGAIGAAVNRAIDELAAVIAAAPADETTRRAWLERLHEARAADEIPYLEHLDDRWGELCVTQETASWWAERTLAMTRRALSPAATMREFYHGTSACLAALYRAERYAELVVLLEAPTIWPYKKWAVKALVALGQKAEALRIAESTRRSGPLAPDVARTCEELLLSSGLVDEAFARYAVDAHRAGTYLARFRAVAKTYPTKSPESILALLVASTPGEEGKWFAAAKDAGLLDEAIALAKKTPTDPRTLARAARDHVEAEPGFAIEAGLTALEWIARGHGYDVTSADVWAAYVPARDAADRLGSGAELRARLRSVVGAHAWGEKLVGNVLRDQLTDA